MFHLTIFSGAEARLIPDGSTSLTLFGSTILAAPTVAQRAVHLARRRSQQPTRWQRMFGRDHSLLVTVFGYTEIALPTLVEELGALRELSSRSGTSRPELRALCDQLRANDNIGLDIATLTLFAQCHVGRPSAKKELAAIERARKHGEIDTATGTALERLIGRSEGAIIGGLAEVALA